MPFEHSSAMNRNIVLFAEVISFFQISFVWNIDSASPWIGSTRKPATSDLKAFFKSCQVIVRYGDKPG
jgi:hypothetical protein